MPASDTATNVMIFKCGLPTVRDRDGAASLANRRQSPTHGRG